MASAKKLHYAWIVAAVTFVVGTVDRGGARRARGVDHPARTGIRLVAGDDFVRYRHQSAALRSGRAVRRGPDGSLWRAPNDDHRANDNCRFGSFVASNGSGVAAGFAVGRDRRSEHRRYRRLSIGLYRGSLVSPAPGACGRVADCRQRCRAAGFSTEPGRARHPFRVAHNVVGSGRVS